jgi:hypothetical protein
MVSSSKLKRFTAPDASRAVSQKLFSFWQLPRSCIDSDTSPAPLATVPKISAMAKFNRRVNTEASVASA